MTGECHEATWLAGLLEGEGCFSPTCRGFRSINPRVTLDMTDLDVIERASRAWPGASEVRTTEHEGRKTSHRLVWQGEPAILLMRSVLPDMGKRRGEKILAVIADLLEHKTKPCSQCGVEFFAHGRNNGTLCSDECKTLAARARNRKSYHKTKESV